MDASSRAIKGPSNRSGHSDSREHRLFPRLNRLEAGYLVLCFCVYLFWTLTFTSMSYGPDEYMRYDIPRFIYNNNALPVGPEESIRNSIWGVSYGFDMPVVYIIAACFMKIAALFSQDANTLLIAARMVCVLATTGAAYFAILFAKRTMGDSPVRWVFIILISLLPQIVFLSSYFNLDSYSLFTVMMIVYAWSVCLERAWDRPSSLLLAVSLGLCLLGYQFSYSYVLATFFLYVSWYLLNRSKFSFGRFIGTGLIILAVVFAICGWRYVRNALLYDGDFLSLHASEPYAELYAMEEYKPSVKLSLAEQGMSVRDMLTRTEWKRSTFRSLIGGLGYMNIWLPEVYYKIYNILIAVGLGGVLFGSVGFLLRRKREGEGFNQSALLMAGWMLFASVITVGLSIYFSWSSDYQPQGRYIIAVTPLLFSMIAVGFGQWARAIGGLFRRRAAVRELLEIRCAWFILGFVLLSMFAGYVACLGRFIVMAQ